MNDVVPVRIVILIASLSLGAVGQSLPIATKVLLDKPLPSTLQVEADEVSRIIDDLIPGQVPSYPSVGLLCFVAPESWTKTSDTPPPITLVGTPRPGEPRESQDYPVRVALASRVLQSIPEFIFELAHELAHVKMDAHFDNYLVETFAVAVSLEVLKKMRLEKERKDDIDLYFRDLPQGIKSAVGHEDWKAASLYWQGEIQKQKTTPSGSWNFTFAVLGSLLLEATHEPVWANLLGTAAISYDCHVANRQWALVPTGEFNICRPRIASMVDLAPALTVLGYPSQ